MSLTYMLSLKSTVDNKVACIKALRGLTGMGLKESKNMIEDIMAGDSQIIRVPFSDEVRFQYDYVEALRIEGIDARRIADDNPVRNAIGDQVRATITWCVTAGQNDLAKALIDVVDIYCPAPLTKEEKEQYDIQD